MLEIELTRNNNISLYTQIRDAIVDKIEQDQLKSGQKLPPVAELAKQLKVTPSTILRAFEDLSQSGHIESHVGRGTFVTSQQQVFSSPRESSSHCHDSLTNPDFVMAVRRLRMGMAQSLEDLQILTKRPGLIHFTAGVPDNQIAQPDLLKKTAAKVLQQDQFIYQSYSPPGGLLELRKEVAKRLSNSKVTVDPEQVLITSGSQQAVSIIAQSALENKQRILCETPCYMGIPRAFGGVGHWVETIARDHDGPLIERLKNLTDLRKMLLYFCPQLHNPMGVDISQERRKWLIKWAQQNGVLLIADEIFRDLRFGAEAPSFVGENMEQTIVIGSISKSFMCGMRIGWLVSSCERVKSLVALKRAMDIGCAPLMQGIAIELFRSGAYEKHIKKGRKHYRVRCNQILKILKEHMPEQVIWTQPQGGFHMWLELPAGYSSIALFLLALEQGVVIRPGPYFDLDHRFISSFALSYGSVELDKVTEGVKKLAIAVKTLLQQPPGETGLSGVGDFI